MSQVFAYQLSLKIQKINIEAEKIDGTTLGTYGMIVFTFSMSDKNSRERFFEGSFLLADIKSDVVVRMSFLIISNIDIDFQAQDIQWRSYTTENVFSTTEKVELIGKKEFIASALDREHEAFIEHVATFNISFNSGDEMHSFDFVNVFLSKFAVKLHNYTKINNYAIKLVNDRQSPYDPIYISRPVELEKLKNNIENNLVNSFIWFSKSPIGAPIFFDKKTDSSLQLYIDYRDLNKRIIKNRYLLHLLENHWINQFGLHDSPNSI